MTAGLYRYMYPICTHRFFRDAASRIRRYCGKRLARRLVEMDMHARVHASLRRVEQVADPRLDEHRPEPRHVEQLLAGHPGQATIDLLRLCPLPQPTSGSTRPTTS